MAADPSGVSPAVSDPKNERWRTCRVCKETFKELDNGPTSCRFHPSFFRGAAAAWYLDIFTRERNYSNVCRLDLIARHKQESQQQTDDPEREGGREGGGGGGQKGQCCSVMGDRGRTDEALASGKGTVYFYECCGALDIEAEGCTKGYHKTYDEPDD